MALQDLTPAMAMERARSGVGDEHGLPLSVYGVGTLNNAGK